MQDSASPPAETLTLVAFQQVQASDFEPLKPRRLIHPKPGFGGSGVEGSRTPEIARTLGEL